MRERTQFDFLHLKIHLLGWQSTPLCICQICYIYMVTLKRQLTQTNIGIGILFLFKYQLRRTVVCSLLKK